MKYFVAICIFVTLVVFYITIYRINKKIPRPDIGDVDLAKCSGCKNKACEYNTDN